MLLSNKFKGNVVIEHIQGHSSSKIQKRSEYDNEKLNGIYRDHPTAYAISNPASVEAR